MAGHALNGDDGVSLGCHVPTRDGRGRTDAYRTGHDIDESGTEYAEEGAAALLLVVGIVLFFFPEPFTSLVGIGLILGAATWLADYFMG